MLEKLTAPDELSGMLNVAVAVYAIARERGGFTPGLAPLVDSDEIQRAVDPVSTFVDEVCARGPNMNVPKADLYRRYDEWSLVNRMRTTGSARRFHSRIAAMGFGQKTVHGREYWVGLEP